MTWVVGLAAVVVLGLALLMAPAQGRAASIYQHSGAFGGACADPGQPVCPADGLFRKDPLPQRMVVHQVSGKLFVADPGDNRVQVFTPTALGATFAYSIPTPAPQAVAIDPVTSDLYVVNRAVAPNPGRVTKFNPDDPSDPTSFTQDATFTTPVQGSGAGQVGGFSEGTAPTFPPTTLNAQTLRGGIAVDPGTREILVVDTTRNQVHRFTSDGAYVSSFNGADGAAPRAAFSRLMDLAVLPNGDVVTADFLLVVGTTWRPRIDRYSPAGQLQATLSAPGHNEIAMDFQTSYMALGVDPVSGEVFAASQVGNDWFLAPPGPPVQPGRVYQFENDELANDFGISGNGLRGYKTGIAVKSNPGRLYVLSTNVAGYLLPSSEGLGVPRVQVFDAATPPTAAIDPVDAENVSARTAIITGTVNAKGQQTSWRVQYRKAGVAGWPNQTDPMPVGDEDADVAVQTEVTGLEPFTAYQARIVAENAGGLEAPTGPVSFETKRAAPEIGSVLASFLGATSVEIRAEINPLSAPTRFWVEYGLSDSYGSRAPAAPDTVDAGSSNVASLKMQPLAGLQPGTEYHYRVVAENDVGQTAESDDAVFATLATDPGGLQGARGYELATWQPLGFQVEGQNTAVADHGNSALIETAPVDPHPSGADEPNRWMLGERGESAWKFRLVDLPDPSQIFFTNDVLVPTDMSRVFAATRLQFHPDDQNEGRDLFLNTPGETPTWITRSEVIPEGEPQTDGANSGYLLYVATPTEGAIAKGGVALAFGSKRPLTADDPNPSNPSTLPTGPGTRLYKWKDNDLTLISVRPDGSTPTGPSLMFGGTVTTAGPQYNANSPHAISEDGNRLFWSDATSIFVHVDGEERSRLVGNGVYVDALPDGSRAFYTSGGRMYSYDVEGGVTRDLTGAAQLAGPVAVAESGRRVYFVARAALDADASPRGVRPVAGKPNLYVKRLEADGSPLDTRLVAVLGDSDVVEAATWHARISDRTASASPDGRVLAFASRSVLTGQPTANVMQAFVYDDEARSLVCVSCPADGSAPGPKAVNGNLSAGGLDTTLDTGVWHTGRYDRRLVSSDGTVFFDTVTPLVAQDQNLGRDVYEYRNGQLRMLTTGSSGDGASVGGVLSGASVDGSTVFILSSEQYDPRDIEPGFRKLWAFRVGGGFPYNGPTPGCSGQGCEGDLQVVPDVPPIGSDGLRGQGNLEDGRPARKVALAVRQAKGGKGATVSVRVTAPGAGRITVTGKGVRKTTRSTSRAGGYTIKVKLSGSSSKALARRGALSARVKVSFKPRAGKAQAKRLQLKFKRPSTRKGARR